MYTEQTVRGGASKGNRSYGGTLIKLTDSRCLYRGVTPWLRATYLHLQPATTCLCVMDLQATDSSTLDTAEKTIEYCFNIHLSYHFYYSLHDFDTASYSKKWISHKRRKKPTKQYSTQMKKKNPKPSTQMPSEALKFSLFFPFPKLSLHMGHD